MRNTGKQFIFGVIGLLILGLPASAEEIAGQWHALFDTPAGMQTYHFDFQNKDGKLTAKAVVESADQKRDVEFEEAELDGDTLKFVERRQFGDRVRRQLGRLFSDN